METIINKEKYDFQKVSSCRCMWLMRSVSKHVPALHPRQVVTPGDKAGEGGEKLEALVEENRGAPCQGLWVPVSDM